jgi:hypothetical protein
MARPNERRAAIERWLRLREKQGLTLREISTRSGIPEGTLSWWAHRLRHAQTGVDFVEVRVAGEASDIGPPAAMTDAHAAARVRLPSGITITLRGGAAQRLTETLLASVARW